MRTSLLLASLLANVIPAQGDHLYSVTTVDGLLRRVNPLTGATSWAVQLVTTGAVNVQSCNGLARDPVTGQLYAIVREVGAPSVRKLASIDPQTGTAVVIGPLGDNFASMAFRADGVLFAVTGDGALVPETLYSVDVNTAVASFKMTLGNGTNGEAIGFGADGFLYHASGLGVPNVQEIFERIDTVAEVITPVTLSGFGTDEVLSITSWAGGNLLVADRVDRLVVTNTAGVVQQLATLDHSMVKGLAFVPSPDTQPFFRPYGDGCAPIAGTIPLLAGSGVPSPGLTVQLDLVLAPFSLGVLGIGSGNLSAPFPSQGCQVQILPLWQPDLVTFATTLNGTWTASFVLPAGLPSDLFFQAAVVDAGGPGGLIVSNALRTHIL